MSGRIQRSRATPTMEDVARAAGVSRSLVSLVFQDSPKVAPGTRDRVLAAAHDLGYEPNALASSLASGRVRTIGVLLDDLSNPFFAHVYDAILEHAEAAGYSTLLAAGQRSADRESAALRDFRAHRVSGLVLVSPRLTPTQVKVGTAGLPTVVVGRDVRLPNVDAVVNDEARGARAALSYLIAEGHTDIVHVSGGSGAGAAERRRAYEAGMSAAGLGERASVIEGDFTEKAGAAAAGLIMALDPLPSAVFAANDVIAVGLMGALGAAGISVPNDVSVVGYDNLALAELGMISLSSVAQPVQALGRAAIDLLLERLDEGRVDRARRRFQPELIVRQSSGPPGPRRSR